MRMPTWILPLCLFFPSPAGLAAASPPAPPAFPGVRWEPQGPRLGDEPLALLRPGARRFTLWGDGHVQLARTLGGSPAGRRCSEVLVRAQWFQDVRFQTLSRAHFDNCAFDEGLGYLQELLREADGKVRGGQAEAALFPIGQALHALQDFYAHSNYVEIMERARRPWGAVAYLPLWTEEGAREVRRLAQAGDLVSGRIAYSTDIKRCAPSGPTHGQLAKDDLRHPAGKRRIEAFQRSGHEAARELALAASAAFLAHAHERWPALRELCGPVTAVAALHEGRADLP